MERILQSTADGSHTIAIPEMQVTYHSKHGAIQESMHVFIEAGLKPVLAQGHTGINLLEMGFGTGLNALLTAMYSPEKQTIQYVAIEAYPIEDSISGSLNYCELLNAPELEPVFRKMHAAAWSKPIAITPSFTLLKIQGRLQDYQPVQKFNLVYFDAFAPNAQPELWTTEIFTRLYNTLEEEGILVTYCSKGDVRRALIAAGFTVEKIPGPPGKREMLRAIKKNA
jgi:tRNA U34 5-methylaminomethyl-2-thiouridine-forming methyltransferase MnmC